MGPLYIKDLPAKINYVLSLFADDLELKIITNFELQLKDT